MTYRAGHKGQGRSTQKPDYVPKHGTTGSDMDVLKRGTVVGLKSLLRVPKWIKK